MWKNIVHSDRPQMKYYGPCALYVGYKQESRLIPVAFLRRQWLRASMLRHTYIACLVSIPCRQQCPMLPATVSQLFPPRDHLCGLWDFASATEIYHNRPATNSSAYSHSQCGFIRHGDLFSGRPPFAAFFTPRYHSHTH